LPLIHVHLTRDLFNTRHEQIGQAIHEAQVEALGIPEDDRFQVFQPHEADEFKFDAGYNGVHRHSLLIIRITAVRMYSADTKRAFFKAVVGKLEPLGVAPEDVLICLAENGIDDWYAGRI
jgi:hypothetical protein